MNFSDWIPYQKKKLDLNISIINFLSTKCDVKPLMFKAFRPEADLSNNSSEI